MPRFEPVYLGRAIDALANSAMPLLVEAFIRF
jgi:hypothetical protein